MADFNLPNFSINLDSVNADILELLKIIKPEWSTNDIKIKTLHGGYSGCTSCAIFQDNKNDAVTIKVRKLFANEDDPLNDKDFEIEVIQLASKQGIFSKIYAVFQNGYCYQYIRGKPITNNDPSTTNPSFKSIENIDDIPYKLIANKLAQIHCMKVDGKDYSKSETFTKILKYFDSKYPSTPSPNFIEKDIIRKELNELMSYASKLELNVVQCHGDLNLGNIVWNRKEDSVTLVDWELVSIGYQAYDIVTFLMFIDSSKYFTIPGMPIYNDKNGQQLKNEFITLYLSEYFRLSKQGEKVPEDYLEKFRKEVKFCTLIWYIFMEIFIGAFYDKFSKLEHWKNMKSSAIKIFQDYTSIKDDILRDLQLK